MKKKSIKIIKERPVVQMAKTCFAIKLILSTCISFLAIGNVCGRSYELVWSTIDGGGGTSAGGQYVLTGTIGQPDAEYSSSGRYELLGGFWPGGLLCFVDFPDFARFAELWLYEGEGLPADLNNDEDVDLEDLKQFVDYWLLCCPYNWPLR